jgi:hypothetical protein
MRHKTLFATLVALLLIVSISLPSASNALPAAQAQRGSVQLTVYNQDLALVSETRLVPLKNGLNSVVFSDVAALIDPTSVSFPLADRPGRHRGVGTELRVRPGGLGQAAAEVHRPGDRGPNPGLADLHRHAAERGGQRDPARRTDGAVTMLSQEQIRNIELPCAARGAAHPPQPGVADRRAAGGRA